MSVIRQKCESQNGCLKKTKHTKFSGKKTFLTPWYAHVRQWVRNVRFSENLACCFLETPVLRFALLPYYQRNEVNNMVMLYNLSVNDQVEFITLVLRKLNVPDKFQFLRKPTKKGTKTWFHDLSGRFEILA